MMTGTPIESNVWMAYLLTVFLVVTGFAVYDILYRRVPDRALVFFIPLAALAPLIQVYFILEYDRMPIFIWPVVTEALMGALLGFCIPLAAAMATGGSGMGDAENFKLVEELAALLGGVVGASRPAIEEGWASRAHQVGQSGKIVAPKLYIACGVSGAMQHVSGIMGSKYIVAINKDEAASIFDIADVGIVGDVKEILPLLIEEIKARK